MSYSAIEVRGLGKRYRLGARQASYGTLRESLVAGARRVASSARGMLQRGEARDSSATSFWALKDVSFDVGLGEVIGIIGQNGAGKSTLLKILSRIVDPTMGSVTLHGRVGSLLEVGTGFHPELTGRENIFLNGAIIGMRKTEIARNFDEIVAFAEVEQFLDTAVKHYSSGMYMRLAFAVAAHLEPEILIVDEVLAVGDAAFQKKCMGKMGDVARHGRTVLFVSHNMSAVAALCTRAILLQRGSIVRDAGVSEVTAMYQASLYSGNVDTTDLSTAPHIGGTQRARLASLKLTPVSRDGTPISFVYPGQGLEAEIGIRCIRDVEEANVCLIIYDSSGYRLIDVNIGVQGTFLTLRAGEQATVRFRLENIRLRPATYLVGLWIGRPGVEDIDGIVFATTMTVEDDLETSGHSQIFPGPYQVEFSHSLERQVSPASDPVHAVTPA